MSDEQRNGLPPGWAWTTLGEITQPSRPRHNPKDYPELPFIGMEHVEAHTMRLLGTVSAENMQSSSVHFYPNDVLYGRLRPYLNKVYRPEFEGLCSAEFIVFPASEHLSSKYLQYLLNSSAFVSFATHLNQGDRPRVDYEQVASYSFALAPLLEQHRIVEKIETQFSRLEAAANSLKRMAANLQRLRAATLKAACEGRLVPTEHELARIEGRDYESADRLLARTLRERRARWEVDQLAKMSEQGKPPKNDKWKAEYAEPVAPNTTGLPALPEGWTWVSPAQLSAADVYALAIGPFGSNLKVSDYQDEGVPLVFVRNIRSGVFDSLDTRYVSLEKAYELSPHIVVSGDILITKMGDPPGDARLYPKSRPYALITADCIKWTLSPILEERRYFVNTLNSQTMRTQIMNITKGVAQQKISLARFKSVAIPLPPLAEQQRIVTEVERRLSIIDEIETATQTNLRRAEVLRQRILQHAFTGKLVAQDTNDEPAGVLLARIRVEKLAREQEAKAAQKVERTKMTDGKRNTKQTKPQRRRLLREVISEADRRLKPEELFSRAGFTSELVEEFYEELRAEVSAGSIKQERPNDSDVYLVAAAV